MAVRDTVVRATTSCGLAVYAHAAGDARLRFERVLFDHVAVRCRGRKKRGRKTLPGAPVVLEKFKENLLMPQKFRERLWSFCFAQKFEIFMSLRKNIHCHGISTRPT